MLLRHWPLELHKSASQSLEAIGVEWALLTPADMPVFVLAYLAPAAGRRLKRSQRECSSSLWHTILDTLLVAW